MNKMKKVTKKRKSMFFLAVTVCISILINIMCSPIAAERVSAADGEETVLLGGMSFGVRIMTNGVTVIGVGSESGKNTHRSPAYLAGIREKDIITALDGKAVSGAADISNRINNSDGKPIRITVVRQGTEKDFSVIPEKDGSGAYKIGIWLRDSSAGIGTVTFIDPDSGAFGGLGHGICDIDTGEPVTVRRGDVHDAVITGITKGMDGKPGELRGYLGKNRIGALFSNTSCGVFGIFTKIPAESQITVTASSADITVGDATLYSSVDGSIKPYRIRISSIDRNAPETKCFTIEVTDPELLGLTGGIVQGMSGSPIVQNGCLVGAVTHVLISNPKGGYGIFIENMLSAMPNLLM